MKRILPLGVAFSLLLFPIACDKEKPVPKRPSKESVMKVLSKKALTFWIQSQLLTKLEKVPFSEWKPYSIDLFFIVHSTMGFVTLHRLGIITLPGGGVHVLVGVPKQKAKILFNGIERNRLENPARGGKPMSFRVGDRVELTEEVMQFGVRKGARGRVAAEAHSFGGITMIAVEWDPGDPAVDAKPGQFFPPGWFKKIRPIGLSPDELRKANSRKGALFCVNCGARLVNPIATMKYCPKCEG